MKREYTTAEKAHALEVLAQTGGNLLKASRLTGYPRKSIAYWANQTGVRGSALTGIVGEQNSPSDSPVRRLGTEADRQEMVVKWHKAAALNADELANPEKIRKATLRDNTIAAGTAQDKLNILTGGVTSRTEAIRIELVGGARSLKELAALTMGSGVSDDGHGIIDVPARALPGNVDDVT